MFNPGETIGNTFVIPFRKEDLQQVIVSYKQDGNVVLERTITSGFITHVNPDGTSDPLKTDIRIVLTQEESLQFSEKHNYTIQLNVLTEGHGGSGSRHASCEIKGSNGVQHHKEVMASE